MNIKRGLPRSRPLAFLLLFSILTPVSGCALSGEDPPPVQHSTVGDFADCRACHATGAGGAPVIDHLQRAECLFCHKPQENGGR